MWGSRRRDALGVVFVHILCSESLDVVILLVDLDISCGILEYVIAMRARGLDCWSDDLNGIRLL
jgi:hypothetical protein